MALKPGDIVFARTGATTGKSFLVRACPEDAVFASYLIRVRLDDTSDPRFVSHFFGTPRYWAQISQSARGVAQPGVNATVLGGLRLPSPPLAEQRRIADILDRANALRAKRRAALALLDTLAKSIFQAFAWGAGEGAWPRAEFGVTMAEVYRYPTYFGIRYESDGVPEIRGELLRSDGTIVTDRCALRFISRRTSERFPRTVLRAGDLVMSVRGTIGKVSIVPPELEGANMTANLMRLSPNRKLLDPVFAWYLTQSEVFRHQLVSASSTTTITTIKAPDIKGIEVPLPPLAVQQQFARRAAALNRLREAHQASLAQLDALFASLQHRAFRGEL